MGATRPPTISGAVIDPTNDLASLQREAEHCLNRGDIAGLRGACNEMLQRDPSCADAYFLLGIAAASTGRFAPALDAIDRAVAIAPGRADYHAQRGRCLLMLRRDSEARAAAQRALELEPADALTLDTLGVVLTHVGAHREAADAFARAVERAPNRADFAYNLGASLRILGEFSGAEAAFERALCADPRLFKAYSVLAELRSGAAEDGDVDRLKRVLAEVGDDVDGELHVRHALATLLESRGDYAEAFAQLAAGKARKRAALGYTFEQDRRLFERLHAVCDAAWLSGAGAGCPSAEPIFVVGMPRTGTTLVERILSSHPRVSSVGELMNFAVQVKKASRTRTPQVLDPETISAAAETDLAALGAAYLESTRPASGRTPRFVDKMPVNFLYIGFIAAALPNARIVCVRRDPLDACLAVYRRLLSGTFPFYRFAYDLADIGRYYACFDRLMRHWRRLLGSRLYELRYETLVSSQRDETTRLLAYLELEWDDACMAFEQNPAPVATASAVQVRAPLNAGGVGRWRRFEHELAQLRAQLRTEGIDVGDGSSLVR